MNNALEISFEKKIVLSNVDDISSNVFNRIETTSARMVIFNMRNVRILDSLGIGFLLNSLRKCNALGLEFKLSNVSPVISELLENLKLKDMFNIIEPKEY